MDLANEGDETTSLVGAYDEYYQMGVRSLMEKENIKKVPNKYILSEAERPNYNLEINNTNLINLPVIDFAQLQSSNRSLVINSLAKACQDYGFFQLVNHGIKGDVIDRMKDASKRFFELPSSERSKYMSNDMCSPVRYGTSFNQNNDKVYCWRDFLKLSCHPALSQNFPHHWPSSPLDLREAAVEFSLGIKSVYMMILSNGRYKSVLHRVVVNSSKSRMSIASLHSVGLNCMIEASPKLIDETNPKRYMDTDFSSFLHHLASRQHNNNKTFLDSRKLF
ncbi:hypothetical protein F8388_002639 [Cannabis sativa]|uniref:Uncharacterized protein n=1 Tax=Cannabis sativa TaxID=3483 RepID=A0A7J6HYS9_CANSA|nr:hypothetical protein F8388_002639 [Cannabis sativa]KAF4399961.1 hypothetical protein G4B88_021175 [Cannabis sativa]